MFWEFRLIRVVGGVCRSSAVNRVKRESFPLRLSWPCSEVLLTTGAVRCPRRSVPTPVSAGCRDRWFPFRGGQDAAGLGGFSAWCLRRQQSDGFLNEDPGVARHGYVLKLSLYTHIHRSSQGHSLYTHTQVLTRTLPINTHTGPHKDTPCIHTHRSSQGHSLYTHSQVLARTLPINTHTGPHKDTPCIHTHRSSQGHSLYTLTGPHKDTPCIHTHRSSQGHSLKTHTRIHFLVKPPYYVLWIGVLKTHIRFVYLASRTLCYGRYVIGSWLFY